MWKRNSSHVFDYIEPRKKVLKIKLLLSFVIFFPVFYHKSLPFFWYFFHNPMGTRYCGDIGFLLDLHRDIDRLRIEIEVTSLFDIFFQHHNDIAAIT